MGIKGNLQFTEQEGGTVPAPRAGAPSPETSPSFTGRRAVLEACVTGESSEVRVHRESLVQARAEVRANSRLIGNLLGSLTARVDGAGHFVNPDHCSAIAQALKELNTPLSGAGFYLIKGAKYCLDTYLEELKEFDLVALTRGVLSRQEACKAVLDMISPREDDALRIQAACVLRDVAKAVDQRVVCRYVHEPLSKVVDLLDAHPVDPHKLCAQLIKVSDNEYMLDQYFKKLSADELKKLRSVLLPENSSRARQALFRMTAQSQNEALAKRDALAVLGQVSWSFESAYSLRANEIIGEEMLFRLRRAVDNEHRFDVCTLLRQLSVRVSKVLAIFGELPYYTIMDVQDYTSQAMDVLRDQQNNPFGALNGHSLRKLDDGMRKNLGAAAVVLCNFGLEMEPELRVC